MKKLISILLSFALCFSIATTASASANRTNNFELIAPNIANSSNGILAWHAIDNAKYEVEINGETTYTSNNFIELASSDANEGTWRVRAITDKATSLWSDYTSYSKTTALSGLENIEALNDAGISTDETAQNYIGAGYNVLSGKYFDPQQINMSQRILKLPPVLQMNINAIETGSATASSFISESVVDISRSEEESMSIGASIEGGFLSFTASASAKYSLDSISNFEKNTKTYFFSQEHVENGKQYQLEYGSKSTLTSIISSGLINALKRNTTATKQLSDDELMDYIFRLYGTHVIVGLNSGAKLQFSNSILTQTTLNSNELQKHLEVSIQASMGKIADLKAHADYKESIATTLKSSTTTENFIGKALGGVEIRLKSVEDISQEYDRWVQSLQNGDRYAITGIAENGLIPLWEILPSDMKLISLSMQKRYVERIIENSNQFTLNFSDMGVTHIKSSADFLTYMLSNPTGNYALTTDIVIDNLIQPIKSFNGRLNGGGHSITISNKHQIPALFSNITGSIIENLNIYASINIQSTSQGDNAFLESAVLASRIDTSIIRSVTITGNASFTVRSLWERASFGAICAYATSVKFISNTLKNFTINTNACKTGGLAGEISDSVESMMLGNYVENLTVTTSLDRPSSSSSSSSDNLKFFLGGLFGRGNFGSYNENKNFFGNGVNATFIYQDPQNRKGNYNVGAGVGVISGKFSADHSYYLLCANFGVTSTIVTATEETTTKIDRAVGYFTAS